MDSLINLRNAAEEAWEDALRRRGLVNILLVGRSGVGKSTLINTVFQGNIAETGQGRPITPNIREITKEGIPVTIFDTRGLEMGEYQQTSKALVDLIRERSSNSDPNRHIHIVWFCILQDSDRVELGAETALCKTLAEYVPVIGVITKSRSDNGMRQTVLELMPDVRNVVRVRALRETLDDGHVMEPMGIDKLIDLTMEIVPEGHRAAFAAAQRVNVHHKINQARKVVAGAATVAGAAGAVPIPFSDAALLVPIQMSMLAGISTVFGLSLDQGFLATLLATVTGAGGAAAIGRLIVLNALKLLPGVGIATGVINGAVASSLTVALGEAYIATLVYLTKESGGQAPAAEDISRVMKERLLSGVYA